MKFGVLILLLGNFWAKSGFADDQEAMCIARAATIELKLSCLQGVAFNEIIDAENVPPGSRRFDLSIEQPIDHFDLSRGTFRQRLVLLFRGDTEPLVLQTSGYMIFGVRETLIAKTFGTNQLQVEHRFFGESIPTALDWRDLNIRQSAEDFHRITVAFRQIFSGRWVNTGSSKGGMTSIYHRRFYPDDLDGTVADVAPLSFSRADARYITFLESVGGPEYADCRGHWQELQRSLLAGREQLVPQLVPGNFSTLGGPDVAFEHAVIESSFFFWQYAHPDDPDVGCDKIPVGGTLDEQFAYFKAINDPADYADEEVTAFAPYSYQAATQLGSPGLSTSHIEPLRKYEFTISQYAPVGVDLSYSNSSMHDVDQWVRTASSNVIFIYGEFDPWSAGAFDGGRVTADNFRFFVKGGNHGSKFSALAEAERAVVLERLAVWLNKTPIHTEIASRSRRIYQSGSGQTLEDLEFTVMKQRRHKIL